MKRYANLFMFAMVLVVLLASCGTETYEDGYEAGYIDGYAEAQLEVGDLCEKEFSDGYEMGYDDGFVEGSEEGWIDNIEEPARYIEEEAVHYAREHSGCHPEEAMVIIYSYQNKELLHDDRSLPTQDEYIEAIESLYRFYEYFYGAMYD